MDRGEAVFDEKPKKQTVRLKKKGSENFPCNISHEKFHESYWYFFHHEHETAECNIFILRNILEDMSQSFSRNAKQNISRNSKLNISQMWNEIYC